VGRSGAPSAKPVQRSGARSAAAILADCCNRQPPRIVGCRRHGAPIHKHPTSMYMNSNNNVHLAIGWGWSGEAGGWRGGRAAGAAVRSSASCKPLSLARERQPAVSCITQRAHTTNLIRCVDSSAFFRVLERVVRGERCGAPGALPPDPRGIGGLRWGNPAAKKAIQSSQTQQGPHTHTHTWA
jgi:hypothetical protein